MKLKSKIIILFATILGLSLLLVYMGITRVFYELAENQMKKQAQTFGLIIQQEVEKIHAQPQTAAQKLAATDAYFARMVTIAEQSGSFAVSKIILIKPDFQVEAAFPSGEKNKNYSAHEDIRESFEEHESELALEKEEDENGKTQTYLDIVSFLKLAGQAERVLEIKLNFKKTAVLLEEQYQQIETQALLVTVLALFGLLGFTLYLVTRAAIRPVQMISGAMTEVEKGNLDITVPVRGNDEFAKMAENFNQMVHGLKEKLHLSSYVSDATRTAVSQKAKGTLEHRVASRKKLTVFFSDIRGFTAFSEEKEPAQVIQVLNRLLSLQAEFIFQHGGDIDKFVGDETMAVFSSPAAALACSLAIQQKIGEENRANPGLLEGLQIGIGIQEGKVVQGDVGSEKMKDFTVIGDTVNTAARLQALALGGEIVVTETLARQKKLSGQFDFAEKSAAATIRGKKEKTAIYLVKRKKI